MNTIIGTIESLVIADPRKGDSIRWGDDAHGSFEIVVAVRSEDGDIVTYDAFCAGLLDSRRAMNLVEWQTRMAKLRDRNGAAFTRK